MTENVQDKIQRDLRKNLRIRIIIYVLILAALVAACYLIFNVFRTNSNARIALREAKNIKISLEMADMELSATGLTIYDETADGNVRKGALSFVNRMQGNPEGRIRLNGYDSSKRKITGYEYEIGDYIVRYKLTSDGDSWGVYMIKEVTIY